MNRDKLEEYKACLSLKHARGIGPRTWKKLLDRFGSAREAIANCRSWQGCGLAGQKQVDAFWDSARQKHADAEYESALSRRMSMVLYTDPRYPDRLRQIPDPPLFLYYLGDLDLLARPGVAVVGGRNCSAYGRNAARRISEQLSFFGLTVISGCAWGIDREAHLGGLEGPGSSVAVLGTGLDLVYPGTNKDLWTLLADKGLIVTEFMPGTRPLRQNFPYRNRVISGLSLGVLVIEAAKKSGSLITARLALEQNREVFALPGPVDLTTFAGSNELIRHGAALVQGAEDILKELAPQLGHTLSSEDMADARATAAPHAAAVKPPDLTGEESALLKALSSDGRMHIDSLVRVLTWDSSQVSRVLLNLEMRGLVRKSPGMYYSLA